MTGTDTPPAAPVSPPAPQRAARHPPGAGAATILLVDPSRACADAVRRLLRGLGARMRRADDMAGARRHLALYRPDAVLVAMGLPDARGEVLIRIMRRAFPPPNPAPLRIVAISSFGALAPVARRAGADAFLARPELTQARLAAALAPVIDADGPGACAPDTGLLPAPGGRPAANPAARSRNAGGASPVGHNGGASPTSGAGLHFGGADVPIDPLALRDDLRRAWAMLDRPGAGADRGHARRFVSSLARATRDGELCALSDVARDTAALTAALRDRIARLPQF
ncbi:MAG: response regulator [Rhodobacteraceae bacterium]|nr:response regulator [Paracoccaceae bacterium]